MKNTSRRYYVRRKPNIEGRIVEWLRPRVFISKNGLNIRQISVGSILLSRKSIGWAVGAKVTSSRYYGWHRPNV